MKWQINTKHTIQQSHTDLNITKPNKTKQKIKLAMLCYLGNNLKKLKFRKTRYLLCSILTNNKLVKTLANLLW